MKTRIEHIGREWFVDILVSKDCWKNHGAYATHEEALRQVEQIRAKVRAGNESIEQPNQ